MAVHPAMVSFQHRHASVVLPDAKAAFSADSDEGPHCPPSPFT